jgi:tetratricopeptide (TPR) repeat protein
MAWLRAFVTAILVAGLAHTAAAQESTGESGASRAQALRRAGLALGYNLDHDAALDTFRQAIAADPTDPASHRLEAATLWIKTLIAQGAVTADDFLGQAGTSLRRPARAAALEAAIGRAVTLAERRVVNADHAPDVQAAALFEVGAAYSLLASYTATVGGGVQKSLSAARRAYRDHQRVLVLDPRRADAGLVVGMYRYAVAVLPFWSRLVARIAGFDGGRAHGFTLVEQATRHPGDVQTNARFALIVIYNREARFDEALAVIGDLQRQYPRNRLLWLEAGATAIRAGRFETAREALERGLGMLAADTRPRAFGELARWRYHLGVALARLGRSAEAERALGSALEGDAVEWVRGRTSLELGALAEQRGARRQALEAYRAAAQYCTAGDDAPCRKDASARIRKVEP